MEYPLDFRSLNALWSSVLVETLVRAGVRRAVISPGSRSTPLTIALARHPGMQSTAVLDERSAAFFALGQSKADLQPTLLLCTSGTAAANYFPAIVEAHESGVPLLVITADRPPELRECASGQTIDQQKMYGGYVGFFHELAMPALEVDRLRYLRQMVLHAVTRSTRPEAGPVHLNAPFRDPLPPLRDEGQAEKFGASLDWEQFFSQVTTPASVTRLGQMPDLIPEAHGAIVVGPNQPADPTAFAFTVGEIARRLGWPVLADGLSPLRHHASHVPQLVTTYDAVLRDRSAAERLKPEAILCVGGWPTSKVLRSWLERSDATTWLVTERSDNRDALHGRTIQTAVDLAALAAALPEGVASEGYAGMWAGYERRARAALDERLAALEHLAEPKAAWLLARHLPERTPLFIANSMPVRDVEYVWPPGDREIRPLCNRGANGIDGTLSTAIGVAAASDHPAVLLSGDLALLHDTNGFLLRSKLSGSLTVILINNRGGGIFEHLPVATFEPPFEEFFATPQDVDFGRLCAAYGIEHVAVRDWSHFVDLIAGLPPTGIRVLELRTDRKKDAVLRKTWFAEIAAGITGAAG